ncbi:MAG: endonuclease/exonuclease/phosphatase family protein [Planctomycetaceae bacterium]|nr:MAG: endonuclease/exonuclease/phosphatase family protein [Planctomycetaceae bacterium]
MFDSLVFCVRLVMVCSLRLRLVRVLLCFLVLLPLLVGETLAAGESVRFATFNIWELTREKLDRVDPETGLGNDPQLMLAAAIIQQIRPDVLLIQEIDYDEAGENVSLFLRRYLAVSQQDQVPLEYPHVVSEPVNTGLPSGLDLNQNGELGDPEDAWGYGRYPGQYGMALLSRLPIARERLRSFQKFRWQQMPGNHIPDGREGRPDWYPAEIAERLRLSSKSHLDIPLLWGDRTVHVLASHPTPPVFDGPEDRNGRRNHDEIRLWADYIRGGDSAGYLVDDQGRRGGLAAEGEFVIMGDLNSDPDQGERFDGVAPIRMLLDHERVQDPRPGSRGGLATLRDRPADQAAVATSHFGRLDYVLPSRGLRVTDCGVYWPALDEPHADRVGDDRRSSDHRLVWVDLSFSEDASDAR